MAFSAEKGAFMATDPHITDRVAHVLALMKRRSGTLEQSRALKASSPVVMSSSR
jgi:hypothetical protein